jgi:hypothetical protein
MSNPERVVSQALRAQAGQMRPGPPPGRMAFTPVRSFPIGWILLIALLLGAVLGVALALVSIFEPGLLPPIG